LSFAFSDSSSATLARSSATSATPPSWDDFSLFAVPSSAIRADAPARSPALHFSVPEDALWLDYSTEMRQTRDSRDLAGSAPSARLPQMLPAPFDSSTSHSAHSSDPPGPGPEVSQMRGVPI
ncbi:hypothetical protein THAOC_27911, partial [Thalassiosira oceanica]